MNNKQSTPKFLKSFHCVENPECLYEANKELFGDYNNYLNSVLEKYNSEESDEY